MWAAMENHPDAIRVLLQHGAEIEARSTVTQPSGRGRGGNSPTGGLTPLLFAVREGALDAVRVLVETGASVNEPAADRTSALATAILNAHYDVARYLLDHGADPNLVNSIGAGPLYLAVNMRNLEISARPSPPGLSREESLEMIKLLLAKGANPNARLTRDFPPRGGFEFSWASLAGATPYMRAAKSSDLTTMKLLVEHGGDPNIATDANTTPLMLVAGVGWIDLQSNSDLKESLQGLDFCLSHGADVNAVNREGQTAVHGAAIRGKAEIIQYLADHGARLDVKDKLDRTPLTYAEGVHISAGSPERQEAAVEILTRLLSARERASAAR